MRWVATLVLVALVACAGAPTRAPMAPRVAPACKVDDDCVVVLLRGCCSPCTAWSPGDLGVVPASERAAAQARACPEPMSCPACEAPEPDVVARCERGACIAAAR